MRKRFVWLGDNILSILAGFLLIFIPLYPKLPLVDILPGYIVRVRFEDFAVLFCVFLWFLLLIRGKLKISENPLFKPIIAYLIVGLLSMVSAIFIIQTVPFEKIHIQKMLLHYLRRIEYFSLFFIFYSTVRSIKAIKIYLSVFIISVLGVAIYGFGQKYLYWPAFSTMNREFAKGWMLYLTEHARVISTFGGHYDLAAFMMMALVMLWSLFFGLKKWYLRMVIFFILASAFWTLILTASRTSFIAYLGGLALMFFFWAYKKGLSWSLSRYLTVTVLSIVFMLSFGDLSERFTKLLRIDQRISGIKSLLLSPIGAPPQDRAIFLENNPNAALAEITAKSDQPPTRRPSDVYQDIPLLIKSGTDSGSLITTSRTYSKTAYRFDLSMAIRLDALWPMAINGFKRNPLVGSGYSTLNKIQQTQFTEAESTDNDYLRSLGETGILGFVTFYGILAIIIYNIWRNLQLAKEPIFFSMIVGFAGLLFGLLINAVYIDVFESSKVAFTFWALTGLTLGGLQLTAKSEKREIPKPSIPGFSEYRKKIINKLKDFISSDFLKLILILMIALVFRLYKINIPLADWHSWRQADTSAVTRNYVKKGISVFYPTYDDLSNIASGMDNPKGLRFVEFPLYNIASVATDKIFVGYNIEVAGRLTSIFASLLTIIILYKLVKKYSGRTIALLTVFFYAIIPYNIFYNRVILPEPFLVFTSTCMIFFFDKWLEIVTNYKTINSYIRHKIKLIIYLLLALVFTAFSVLIKPFSACLFLPMAYLWFKTFKLSFWSVFGLLGYFVIGLLPFVWWRWWASHFPEGIPANMWLFNGDGIRFKGAFFYWIFADRLSRLILGYWGLPLFLLGIVARNKKEDWFYYWWGISMILYLTVVATGNVRHDYYQIILIPIIAIFLAKGVLYLWEQGTGLSRLKNLFLIIIIIVFMEMFSWYHIRDFYNINHPEIVEAGRAAERSTKENSLVIAPYDGDTAFLYQTHRVGWPIVEGSVDDLIGKGAQYYISVKFDDLTNRLISEATLSDETNRKYKLIEQTDKYVIIQLVSDRDLPR